MSRTAYAVMTEHPDHPKVFHEGDYGLFAEEVVAQRICDAWNSYGDPSGQPYPFFVRCVSVHPKSETDPYSGDLFAA